MKLTIMTAMILSCLSIIIMMMTLLISKKTMNDQEKLSPFECGFNPSITPRVPFSLRFFLIALIFLIFDVEVVLLLPLPIKYLNSTLLMLGSFMFIIILSMGLYHEWVKGALNWAQ